jgi:hypothetical protein
VNPGDELIMRGSSQHIVQPIEYGKAIGSTGKGI